MTASIIQTKGQNLEEILTSIQQNSIAHNALNDSSFYFHSLQTLKNVDRGIMLQGS